MKTFLRSLALLLISSFSLAANSTVFNQCTGCLDFVGTGGGVSSSTGVVSPGTFTWQNEKGILLSTAEFNNAGTSGGTAVTLDSGTGILFWNSDKTNDALLSNSGSAGNNNFLIFANDGGNGSAIAFQGPTAFSSGLVTISTNVAVTSTGTTNTFKITANGTYGTTPGTSGGVLMDFTGGGGTSGIGLQLYTNAGTQTALDSPLYVKINNSAYQEPAIWIQDAYTSPQSTIRMESGWPTVTMIDTTQADVSAGKFQWSVNGGMDRIAEGRTSDNTAFDSIIISTGQSGYWDVSVGKGYPSQNVSQFLIKPSTMNVYGLTVSTSGNAPYLISVTTKGVTDIQSLTVSSLTLTGVGNPSFTSADGNTYQIVGSSTLPTNGHLAVWSSSNAIIDGGVAGSGSGGGVTVPSSFTWTGVIASSVQVSTITASSMTMTGPSGFQIVSNSSPTRITVDGIDNPLVSIDLESPVASFAGAQTDGMDIRVTDTNNSPTTNPLNDLVALHLGAGQFQGSNSQVIALWADAFGQSAWDPNITAIYARPGWASSLATGTNSQIIGVNITPQVSNLAGNVFLATGTVIGLNIPEFNHGTGAVGQNWPIFVGSAFPNFFNGPIGIRRTNPVANFEVGVDSTTQYAMIIATETFGFSTQTLPTSQYVFSISSNGVVNSHGIHNFLSTFVAQSSGAISGNLAIGVATTTTVSTQEIIEATPTVSYGLIIATGPSVVNGTVGTDKYVLTVGTTGIVTAAGKVAADSLFATNGSTAGVLSVSGVSALGSSTTISGLLSYLTLSGGVSGTAGINLQGTSVSGTNFIRGVLSSNAVYNGGAGNWTIGNNFGSDYSALYFDSVVNGGPESGGIGFSNQAGLALPTTITNAQFLANTHLYVTNWGGVGVGTTNPTAAFDVEHASGALVHYGVTAGTFTVNTTTVTQNALVVNSTSGVAAFSVSNSTVGANDLMLTVSSDTAAGSSILMSVDAQGNEVLQGSETVKYGVTAGSITIGNTAAISYVATFSTQAAGVGPFMLDISSTGHLNSQPIVNGATVTACGANASLSGNDMTGVITTGAASPTACTLTFAKPYGLSPICFCESNGATACDPTSTSATAITFTLGITETTIRYFCIGRD